MSYCAATRLLPTRLTPTNGSFSAGAVECSVCGAGNYAPTGELSAFTSTLRVDVGRGPFPHPRETPVGATLCILCPDGTYSSAPATSCSTCPAGNYAPAGELSTYALSYISADVFTCP